MAVNLMPALYFDVGMIPLAPKWDREIRLIEAAIGCPLRTSIDPEENDCEEAGTEREQAESALAAGIGWVEIARGLFGATREQIARARKEGM